MIIAETIREVREQVREWKKEGLTVGLVPTMGFLHEGHASLVDRAVSMCDRVVVSDFVNPTQFGPGEDLETYPRDFEHDCALLREHGCSMVFQANTLTTKLVQNGSIIDPATMARHFLFMRAIAYAHGSASTMHQKVTSNEILKVFQTIAG